MLMIISPAKTLDYESPLATETHTQPDFLDDACELIDQLKELEPHQVSNLMSISDKLGVRYLLQGSVRRDGDHVRITARLLDEDGFQLWSDRFDRRLESIFVIQAEIASRVSSEIVNRIVPPQELPAGRTTENMEAYNAYLMGKDVEVSDEAIFADTSATIEKALDKIHEVNHAKTGISRKALELAIGEVL